jgi:GNAT superfamily N-acetyltransferase
MIRQAQKEDLENFMKFRTPLSIDVDKLQESKYKLEISRRGFLLPGYDENDFLEHLKEIFLLDIEENGEINGYIRIDHVTPELNKENSFFYNDKLMEEFFKENAYETGAIGVREDMVGKGIGKNLLEQGIKILKEKGIKYLFAFVVISPITNYPSLMFHDKYGFERIAMLKPGIMFGMKNYQSVLFCKTL